ncbi:MAG: hypothetical protein DBX36_02920 [Oscillospiraceae bacterium]|nr:MAG: hypothetical protein DBX36_02920 [Oscillospiraceae bacterium]
MENKICSTENYSALLSDGLKENGDCINDKENNKASADRREVLYGNGAYSSYYTVYKQEIARKKRENSRTHYANTVLSVLFFITAFISILSVTVVTVMFIKEGMLLKELKNVVLSGTSAEESEFEAEGENLQSPDASRALSTGGTEVKKYSDPQIITKRFTGMICTQISDSFIRTYRLPHGVYVENIDTDGTVTVSNIYAGDIITEIGGTPIYTVSDVFSIIFDKVEAQKMSNIEFCIYRNGENIRLSCNVS